MSNMHDDDLDQILRLAFPQAHAILRCEDGTELLRHGARSLMGTPSLALEVLGAKATSALGQAALTLGERYVQTGRAMLALAAAGPSRPAKAARSGASYTEADR
jgi:hypothetical protein